MYQSRFHFEHDNIHLAIDSITGEILELFTLDKNDNIIKNSMFNYPGMFELTWNDGEATHTITPPHSRDALNNPQLCCKVSTEETADGLLVTVSYDMLRVDQELVPIEVIYTALLKGSEIKWNINVDPKSNGTVTAVKFPILNGVWFGETWKNHTLYYPYMGGLKIENPVEYMSEKPEKLQWRWQEYRYNYIYRGIASSKAVTTKGMSGMVYYYPSALSMAWVSLDSPSQSLYFACHDPKSKPFGIETSCIGKLLPGMCISGAFITDIKENTPWSSPDVITWLHSEDWHAGARRYHDFKAQYFMPKRKAPSWLAKSPGLVAHYDFKYQNGGVVHRYKDIPTLALEAKALGYTHMLFAGWHKDGFDCGFPMYYPDDELGTEEELRNGVMKAKELGVHVTFYLNCRIHNRAYNVDKVDRMGIMSREGKVASASYGNPDIKFSIMCPGCKEWQDMFTEAIRRVTEDYCADGVYLDQLSGALQMCYNPDHHHEFDSWSDNYNVILKRITDRYRETHDDELYVSGEWVTDTHGSLVDRNLVQTFYRCTIGSFTDMYRYTFPEHGMVDMIYPSRNLAMRPTHVAQESERIMATIFCNDSYYWVYDLVDDNTFTRDPIGMERLKTINYLSVLRKELMPNAMYRETCGFDSNEDKIRMSIFTDDTNGLLSVYAFEDGEGFDVAVSPEYTQAIQYFADGTTVSLNITDGNFHPVRKSSLILLKK